MNLYRYAMFIARACRGSFVGNVLFANPQMALFILILMLMRDTYIPGDRLVAHPQSARRMNRSP